MNQITGLSNKCYSNRRLRHLLKNESNQNNYYFLVKQICTNFFFFVFFYILDNKTNINVLILKLSSFLLA